MCYQVKNSDKRPLYMAYETLYGGKEQYNEIIFAFREEKLVFTGDYLISLIDTMSFLSMEIFEHYKFMELRFKKVLRNVLLELQESNTDEDVMEEQLKIAYAIMKACNMGVLLKEKYQETGEQLFDAVVKGCIEERWKTESNILMRALEQRMILFKE